MKFVPQSCSSDAMFTSSCVTCRRCWFHFDRQPTTVSTSHTHHYHQHLFTANFPLSTYYTTPNTDNSIRNSKTFSCSSMSGGVAQAFFVPHVFRDPHSSPTLSTPHQGVYHLLLSLIHLVFSLTPSCYSQHTLHTTTINNVFSKT